MREEEVKKVKREQEEGELEGRRERSQREAELVRELGESSLRCARQQETIEKATKKEEEVKNERELQKLQDEVAKLQNERRTQETEATKQEETRIEGVGKLGEEVKRLKEEVVRLKADQKKEEEEKKEKQADVRGDQRTERTKDFLANHSKSTSTDETTYLREERRNETKEDSSQTALTDLNTFTSCQEKTFEEADRRRSSRGSEGKLEDVSLADEVRTDEKGHFTYQFLRRSIFYFLTDKENSGYHLRCMERLLEFTEGERAAIETSRGAKTPSVESNVIDFFTNH